MRIDGRSPSELRKVKLTPNISLHAEGSCLVEFGNTKVMCLATVEPGVPPWLKGSGRGWVTAEYGMLPRSTSTRMRREKIATGGRTLEISRLIGRSLRSVVDLSVLGENQVQVDCDVIQADGGTRTAAITGGFVALGLALHRLQQTQVIKRLPILNYVSAVSVGIHEGAAILDLCYEEDSSADVDMNFVINSKNQFIEIQGTAEHGSFSQEQLMEMMVLATKATGELSLIQHEILKDFLPLT